MRRAVVIKDNAMIYSGVEIDPFTSEPVGSVLEIIPCDSEILGFYNVNVDGKDGFIQKSFVEEIEEEFTEREKMIVIFAILSADMSGLTDFLKLCFGETLTKIDLYKLMKKLNMTEEQMEIFRKKEEEQNV